jgi:hypothetical protein
MKKSSLAMMMLVGGLSFNTEAGALGDGHLGGGALRGAAHLRQANALAGAAQQKRALAGVREHRRLAQNGALEKIKQNRTTRSLKQSDIQKNVTEKKANLNKVALAEKKSQFKANHASTSTTNRLKNKTDKGIHLASNTNKNGNIQWTKDTATNRFHSKTVDIHTSSSTQSRSHSSSFSVGPVVYPGHVYSHNGRSVIVGPKVVSSSYIRPIVPVVTYPVFVPYHANYYYHNNTFETAMTVMAVSSVLQTVMMGATLASINNNYYPQPAYVVAAAPTTTTVVTQPAKPTVVNVTVNNNNTNDADTGKSANTTATLNPEATIAQVDPASITPLAEAAATAPRTLDQERNFVDPDAGKSNIA